MLGQGGNMKQSTIVIVLTLLMFALIACGGIRDKTLSSPEKTLDTYIRGLREGNLETVLRCYYSESEDFNFYLHHPIRIDNYTVTKKTIYTDKMASEYTFVPRAKAGDVELEVKESVEAQEDTFTYLFRQIHGEWRIISRADLTYVILLEYKALKMKYPYTVHKGEISVLGYTLHSEEITATKNNNYVSFTESPNKRWLLIVYDEPFERGIAWLYDKTTKAPPRLVKTARFGRHFGAEWYGDRVFAIWGGGMGYKTSRLFSVDDLDHYKELDDIIAYDPERDIYALLDMKEFKFFIVIGRAFHPEKEERFLIPIYSKYVPDSMDSIKILKFIDHGFTIKYKNKNEKIVTETVKTKIIENAKP
jgi:hypothetical protein